MPAAKPAQGGGVVAVRSKQLLITAPGTLGFSNLVEPDDAFDSLKFKANVHYTEDATDRLITQIEEHGVDALWDDFEKSAAKAGKKPPSGGWVKTSARAWVEDHLKAAKDNARIDLPHISWSNDAEFKDKDGKLQRKTMRAHSAKNELLDLPSLKLGMGSIVQAIVMPGLFVSPLIKQPALSFKLQGVRVLKLVQFGGSGSSLGELDEDDMEVLGDDVELDDLAGFAAAATPAKAPARKAAPAADTFDDDEEIPF